MATVAALLTPGAVVAGWLGIAGTADHDDALLRDNGFTRAAQQRATDQTRVAVLGNSQALAAIDPDALAAALQLPPSGVVSLAVESTRLPLQLALLDAVFYDRGLAPDLVVVAMAWPQLIEVAPPVPHIATKFRAELADAAPLLADRLPALATDDTAWARARAASQAAKDAVLDGLTELPARWVSPKPGARMDRARIAALGDVRMGLDGRDVRMIPVVEAAPSAVTSARPEAPVPRIEHALVGLLAQVVHDHGGRLVVATLPQQRADLRAAAADERAWTGWLADHGVGVVDLEDLDVAPTGWRNDGHLGPEAAQAYTTALATALTDAGALDGGSLALPTVGLAPTSATRSGTPPAVPPLRWHSASDGCLLTANLADAWGVLADDALEARGWGLGAPFVVRAGGVALEDHALPKWAKPCDGSWALAGTTLHVRPPQPDPAGDGIEVTWNDAVPVPVRLKPTDRAKSGDLYLVAPGTALHWTAPAPTSDGRWAITLVALDTPRPAQVARVGVTVGGVEAPLTFDGATWFGEGTLAAGAPVTLDVTSDDAGGPWLAVRGLFVDVGGTTERWVGTADALGDRLPMAGVGSTRHTAAGPPSHPDATVTQEERTATIRLGPLASRLAGPALVERTGNEELRTCSPLRVTGVGAPVPAIKLLKWTPDTPTVGLPAANAFVPRAVVLAPTRRCEEAAWVYPGDHLTLLSDRPRVLARPARWVSLDVLPFVVAPTTLRVVVAEGDTTLLDVQTPLDDDTRRIVLPLDAPVPALPTNPTVALVVDDATYVLVRHAALHATPP
ncbi:MAG: hypothetical protein H6733_01335 [Alphaproteobacteria bacterium]|nr:hypothetical protein [Alphaproteobacteria bacterium]